MRTIVEAQSSEIPEIPVLLTSRLKLRDWKSADLEALSKLYRNTLVTEFFSTVRVQPFSFEELWQTWFRNGFGMWAAVDRKTDEFVGSVGLAFPGNWPNPEISWVLDPKFWGQGLATEAGTTVARFAFEQLRVDRLISVCLAGNQRSERVMQKLGMTMSPESTADPLVKVYGITQEEWQLQGLRGNSTIR